MFSTSGLLFMMVLTLASGSSTSLERSGELVATGVLDTLLRALDTGVAGAGEPSVIFYRLKEITLYISN